MAVQHIYTNIFGHSCEFRILESYDSIMAGNELVVLMWQPVGFSFSMTQLLCSFTFFFFLEHAQQI